MRRLSTRKQSQGIKRRQSAAEGTPSRLRWPFDLTNSMFLIFYLLKFFWENSNMWGQLCRFLARTLKTRRPSNLKNSKWHSSHEPTRLHYPGAQIMQILWKHTGRRWCIPRWMRQLSTRNQSQGLKKRRQSAADGTPSLLRRPFDLTNSIFLIFYLLNFYWENPNMCGQLCRFLARNLKTRRPSNFCKPYSLRSAHTTLFAFDLEHKKTNPMEEEEEEEEVMQSRPVPLRLPVPWIVPFWNLLILPPPYWSFFHYKQLT